jgi:hypothetical protein
VDTLLILSSNKHVEIVGVPVGAIVGEGMGVGEGILDVTSGV